MQRVIKSKYQPSCFWEEVIKWQCLCCEWSGFGPFKHSGTQKGESLPHHIFLKGEIPNPQPDDASSIGNHPFLQQFFTITPHSQWNDYKLSCAPWEADIPTPAFGRTQCHFSSSFHRDLCWDLFPALFNECRNDMERAEQWDDNVCWRYEVIHRNKGRRWVGQTQRRLNNKLEQWNSVVKFIKYLNEIKCEVG